MLKDKIDWLVEAWNSTDFVEHKNKKFVYDTPDSGLTDWHHKALADPKHEKIEKNAKVHAKKISAEESNAVGNYQRASGRFNRPLRKGEELQTESQDRHRQVKHLDRVVKNPLKHDTVVYRGMNKHFKRLPVGSTFHDKGFTGTSLDSGEASEFAERDDERRHNIVGRIFLKKGQHGAYIPHSKPKADTEYQEEYQGLDHEKEFLLPRGMHYKVIGHSLHKDPEAGEITHYVNLEAHHPDEDKTNAKE